MSRPRAPLARLAACLLAWLARTALRAALRLVPLPRRRSFHKNNNNDDKGGRGGDDRRNGREIGADDVVLVTGGGRGIGRWLALEFARQGAGKVVLWGRTEETLRTTCAEVRQAGSDCWYFVCDVADRHAVYRQAQVTRQKVGEVTVLVNNAGVVAGHSLLNIDDEALLSTEHVNVLGHFWTLKAFLPSMLSCGHGHVVCVSSVLALTALPGAIDYCTSKAAAFGLMESLSLGLESTPGVRTTTVLPYLTDTDMFRGVKPRFSWLFPPLHAELVARRTVEAVKRDEAVVFMPRSMVLLVLMKSLLPQAAVDEIYRFMGNYTCMNSLHVQS
uniref:Short-chain dehydrogenase/reductase 3 n=1 Tax=Eptatretus burgeri TaxID=7764 RepID=A0A8C4WQJ4_EPTBU